MSYSKEEINREIIMDHLSNPRNKNKEHNNYLEYTLKNPSCGDMVSVFVQLQKDTIKDITYEVSGCSICTSSTSMMSEILIGKSIDEAKEIINNFNNMMIDKNYDSSKLKDAASLTGISKLPPRIKCATLGYKAFLEAIGEKNEL